MLTLQHGIYCSFLEGHLGSNQSINFIDLANLSDKNVLNAQFPDCEHSKWISNQLFDICFVADSHFTVVIYDNL